MKLCCFHFITEFMVVLYYNSYCSNFLPVILIDYYYYYYRLIWAPAPGKLSLYPSTVQRLLTTQRIIINDTELYEDKEEESVTIEIEEDEHLQDIKQLQQRYMYMFLHEYMYIRVNIIDQSCLFLCFNHLHIVKLNYMYMYIIHCTLYIVHVHVNFHFCYWL